MNHFARNVAVITVSVALTATVLTGCSTGKTLGLAVVVGAHSNSLAFDTRPATTRLKSLIGDSTEVAVVLNDGKPSTAFQTTFTDDLSMPATLRDKLTAGIVDAFTRATVHAVAVAPESAPLEAIAAAARGIAAADDRQILVFDTMLQTTGAMPLQDGRLYYEPSDVVNFLRGSNQLPNLTGTAITIYGLGDVAPPQVRLDERSRRQLTELWKAVLTASGATKVTFMNTGPGKPPVAGLPPVAPVKIEAPAVLGPNNQPSCAKTVLDSATIGFTPDKATFRDPAQANATIEKTAAVLANCPGQITVTGTTSSGDPQDRNLPLSLERAGAVASLLAKRLGVPLSSITVKGVGPHFDGFVIDRDSRGVLNPMLAYKNRLVIITVTPNS